MKITALAPWFGGNRMLAEAVGQTLQGCSWVGVPFCGGCAELAHITARPVVANDLHRHLIALGRVVADPELGPKLYRFLRRKVFHPDELAAAQTRCRFREMWHGEWEDLLPREKLDWAADYFVCVWMSRNGTAGTDGEFTSGLSFRWEAGGGDSAVRFRSAVFGLRDWRRILGRVTFDCRDAFEFLGKCKDARGHGIYCDAPWPDDGDGYRHTFTEADQRRLAERLAEYEKTRIVIRYGDHPLIRELYPEDRWTWHRQTGRTAANKAKAEVLIVGNVTVPAASLFAEATHG